MKRNGIELNFEEMQQANQVLLSLNTINTFCLLVDRYGKEAIGIYNRNLDIAIKKSQELLGTMFDDSVEATKLVLGILGVDTKENANKLTKIKRYLTLTEEELEGCF